MTGLAPEGDFTSQISEALKTGYPCTSGSFGVVYQCTIEATEGTIEVAVKVFRVDPGRAMEKNEKATRRELMVWLRLNHPTIVPLLGFAYVESPFPALVSRWMPSGTLYNYLREDTTLTASDKVALAKGVADGLVYLHSENVIHGDLHPANVLIDGSGNPRLTDFGLATVVGDAELQLSATTATRSFDPRWRSPEVVESGRPTFMSDIYSFGGVMFFIISGDIPWKEKNLYQICIALSTKVIHTRPDNIHDDHWNIIQTCWSWNPVDRPGAVEVLQCIATKITRHVVSRYSKGHSVESTQDTVETLSNMNIVIFGETGAGKSSVINLMAGQQIAHISPDSHRCTLHWTEYTITFKNGSRYQVFETVGLDEPRLQTGEYLSAVTNAFGLINTLRARGGVNLLLFCIRGGRVTATMQSNYRLFFELLCEEKVPLVLVVTNLEREANMEDWYTRNVGHLEKHNIRSAGHACITAANMLDRRHQDKYEESRGILREVVEAHCNASMEGWTGGQGWLASFNKKKA